MKLLSIICCTLFASTLNAAIQENEGYVEVTGGKIWYHVFYDQKTQSNTPLIVLHGGPGAPHNYLLPLKDLAHERPVVFYDQLGCGKSSAIDASVSDHAQLWKIDRFVDELDRLIAHLGYQHVSLLGHSWGTILGFEYYMKKPSTVEKLIFEGPAFNLNLWDRDARYWLAEIPEPQKTALEQCMASNQWETPACQDADMYYNHQHLDRQDPWPQDLLDSFGNISTDVYMSMAGPNEFEVTGSLKGYDTTANLSRISVPTLFLAGEYDEARPVTTKYYASLVHGSKVRIFKNSAHMSHLEETSEFLKEVRGFLSPEVDAAPIMKLLSGSSSCKETCLKWSYRGHKICEVWETCCDGGFDGGRGERECYTHR